MKLCQTINKILPDMLTFLIVIIPILGYKQSIWSIFVWAILIPFIAGEWYFRHVKPSISLNNSILWGFILLSGLTLLAGIVNVDWLSMRKTYKYITYAIPFFAILYMMRNFNVEYAFRLGILCSLLLLSGYGLCQWYMHLTVRITSIWASPNALGMSLELLIPFAVVFFCQAKMKYKKILWGCIIISSGICLYLTGSRGSVLGLAGGILGACVICLILYRHKLTLKQKIISGLLCLVILALGTGAVLCVNEYRNEASGGERVMMIESSWHMWEDHKLTGVGMAHWTENYYGAYQPKGQQEKKLDMPHNLVIYYMSTTGIIGLAGFLSYLILTLWGICQILKADKYLEYRHVAGLIIFLSFILIHGMVDGTLINTNQSKIYYLLLGYAVATLKSEADKN